MSTSVACICGPHLDTRDALGQKREMQTCRIHIMGASGAGVTTLGRALATELAIPHHDTDDYYWLPTNPSFSEKRPIDQRLRLMEEVFLPRAEWVLSGSLESWGDPVVGLLDEIVFLTVPTDVRLARLREREARRYGEPAISSGGWRHEESSEFLEWASHYDDGTREGRSLPRHEKWLSTMTCPVHRLDGNRPTEDLVVEVRHALGR